LTGRELFDDLFPDLWSIFLSLTLNSVSGSKAQEKVHTLVIKPNPLVFQVAEAIQQKCPSSLRSLFMYRKPRDFCDLALTSETSEFQYSCPFHPTFFIENPPTKSNQIKLNESDYRW